MARVKSTGSWGWVIALAGFASGYGTNAAAHREQTPAAVAAPRPALQTRLSSGGERGVFGEHIDVQSEAAAAALSSGTGLGGELSLPLPAL